ncbi:MAG: YDG domain-containing protein, partial [Pseudomonadota bacterium]
ATILTRTLSGALTGDTVSYSGGTATFSNKNVANNKTVTATGLSLSGLDAGNYTVNSSATTLADISALAITGNVTAANKIYDATTAALITGRTLIGAIVGDDITYSGGTATFSNKNVANNKTV